MWSLRECYVPSPPPTHPSASQRARASSFPLAVLVGLYEEPEKPGNALDFIKQYLGASVGVDVEGLRAVTQPSLYMNPNTAI